MKVVFLFFLFIVSFKTMAMIKICALEETRMWKESALARNALRKVYKSINQEVKFIFYPNLRSLYFTNKGICDAEFGRFKGSVKKHVSNNIIKVPTPLVKFPIHLYAKKKNIIKLNLDKKKLAQLCSYRPVYFKHLTFLSNFFTYCEKSFSASGYKQINSLIKNEHSLLALITENDIPYMDLNSDSENAVIKNFFRVEVYHYVHKKIKHLIPGIDKGIKKYFH